MTSSTGRVGGGSGGGGAVSQGGSQKKRKRLVGRGKIGVRNIGRTLVSQKTKKDFHAGCRSETGVVKETGAQLRSGS